MPKEQSVDLLVTQPPQDDPIAKVQRRMVSVLNRTSLRLKRALDQLDESDPGGCKLPEGHQFVKYGKWITGALEQIESLRIRREAMQPDDPVGTPEDDFALAREAVKGLPLERQTLLLGEIEKSIKDLQAESDEYGDGSALVAP